MVSLDFIVQLSLNDTVKLEFNRLIRLYLTSGFRENIHLYWNDHVSTCQPVNNTGFKAVSSCKENAMPDRLQRTRPKCYWAFNVDIHYWLFSYGDSLASTVDVLRLHLEWRRVQYHDPKWDLSDDRTLLAGLISQPYNPNKTQIDRN